MIKIQDFICKPDCAECCGILIFDVSFWEKFKHLKQAEIKEITQDSKKCFILTHDWICIFLNRESKRCMVYDNRPLVCRLYGKIENLECLYIKPNGNERSIADQKRTQRKIKHQVDYLVNNNKI